MWEFIRLTVVLWLLVQALLVGTAKANMAANGVKRQRSLQSSSLGTQFEALEQARDCSVYRAVSRRALGELAEFRRLRAGVAEAMQRRYAELEVCGRERGIVGGSNEEVEAKFAETCPTEYERALVVKFREATLNEDAAELASSHQQLARVLREQCAELPETTELEEAIAPPEREGTEI